MTRIALIAAVVVAAAVLASPVRGDRGSLPDRIAATRAKVTRADRREGVLTGELAQTRIRIAAVGDELGAAQERLARLEAGLERKRAELAAVRSRLDALRDRLERLRVRLRGARRVLAARLVELYKADAPDAVTVILEADGFDDLLERMELLDRIASQDRDVFDAVRQLKLATSVRTERVAALERSETLAAQSILARRDAAAATSARLVSARNELAAARAERTAMLVEVRDERQRAREDLGALEAEYAAVQRTLSAQPTYSPPTGSTPAPAAGAGGLIWPVGGPITSPFGQRWGRLHAGLDIGAAEGTPIRAAAAGRVALAGPQGGYGNYTCVQHAGALSTCYAHQSGFAVSQGATVAQGQVIGYVGNTGNSFGAHLHFETRVGGSPVDPLGYL